MLNRIALGAVSVLALSASAVWWLATGLLADDHSACAGDVEAWAAFGSSFAGMLLALAGLALALANQHLRWGWIALVVYASLLSASVAVSFTCEDDPTKEIDGRLGGGRVTDVASLRACFNDAGARIAPSPNDLRFPTGVEEHYTGRSPNGSRVLFVQGLDHRFRLYFAMEPGMASPGINTVLEDPRRFPSWPACTRSTNYRQSS